MKMIYNKLTNEFLSVDESRKLLFEIEKNKNPGAEWGNYYSLPIENVCDRLNQGDIFLNGECYRIVNKKDDWKICFGGLENELDPPDEHCCDCEHKEECKKLYKELE